MRESPRIRRLRTDLKSLQQLKSESTIIDFTPYGNPPESYRVRFHGKGFYRQRRNSHVLVCEVHEVLIGLGASYPRLMPELAWKTPIFHPNISAGGVVCLGGYGTYWVPSLNLDELCEMLWEMIRYKNFDVGSPYNRDAAHWAQIQGQYRLPIDPRPIRDKLAGASASRPARSAPLAPPPENDILYLDDDIVEAEIVDPDDPDVLILE